MRQRGICRVAALSVDLPRAKEVDGAAALSVVVVSGRGVDRAEALSVDLLRYNGLRRLAAGASVDLLDRRTIDEWVGWCALAAVDETAVGAPAYVARFLMNAVHLVNDLERGVVGVGMHGVLWVFYVGWDFGRHGLVWVDGFCVVVVDGGGKGGRQECLSILFSWRWSECMRPRGVFGACRLACRQRSSGVMDVNGLSLIPLS